MQRLSYDAVVVGGGIIGTATARELLLRYPSLRLAILEKEKSIAAHQSGHNSGVIHSGIYYTPGSLKAKLCVEGLELAYKYCDEKNIPYKKCGKLIVAVDSKETEKLKALFKRAVENRVRNISLLDQEGIRKIEPNVKGVKAIWSPHTGIVDWAEVNKSFARDCVEKGADILLNFHVRTFSPHHSKSGDSSIVVNGQTTDIFSKFVVTCCGLYSDKLAVSTGCSPEPKIIPVRGEYLVLKPEKSHLVHTNIYPVPDPELPFLGVHITPRIDGSVWFGPSAVLAFKREGYKFTDFNSAELTEILAYSGFRKLASKHLSFGLKEMYKRFIIAAQVHSIRKYLPQLKTSDVVRGPAGVRAQALDPDGNFVDDFVFDVADGEFAKRILHVRNAPSPAATSSLPIAKMIVDKLEENCGMQDLKLLK